MCCLSIWFGTELGENADGSIRKVHSLINCVSISYSYWFKKSAYPWSVRQFLWQKDEFTIIDMNDDCAPPSAASSAETFIPFSFARERQLLATSARLLDLNFKTAGDTSNLFWLETEELGVANVEVEEYTLVIGVKGLETMLELGVSGELAKRFCF